MELHSLKLLDATCAAIFEDLDKERLDRRKQLIRQRKHRRQHGMRNSLKHYAEPADEKQQLPVLSELKPDNINDNNNNINNNIITNAAEQAGGEIIKEEKRKMVVRRLPELPKMSDFYVIRLREALSEYGATKTMVPTGGHFCQLDRALVHLYYAQGSYHLVRSTVAQMAPMVPVWMENEIEILWDNATYRLEEQRNPHLNLNSVNMYRLRKRNVCPTLAQSGYKKYRMSITSMDLLDTQFKLNNKPSKAVKLDLAQRTGLRVETISNWFKNKRQRSKRKLALSQANGSQLSLGSCGSSKTSSGSNISPTFTAATQSAADTSGASCNNTAGYCYCWPSLSESCLSSNHHLSAEAAAAAPYADASEKMLLSQSMEEPMEYCNPMRPQEETITTHLPPNVYSNSWIGPSHKDPMFSYDPDLMQELEQNPMRPEFIVNQPQLPFYHDHHPSDQVAYL